MHWSWQNLKGDDAAAWLQGRAWLWPSEGKVLGIAWNIPTRFFHAEVELGGDYTEHDLNVSFACRAFAVWFHTEGLLPRWKGAGHNGRIIGLSIHDTAVWVSLWEDPWEWRSSDPWWYSFSIHPLDILLGKQQYSLLALGEHRTTVRLPEGDYPARVEVFVSVWKRPRWQWWPKVVVRCQVQPDTPIPIPGKGENSWDQDDDALHEMTCAANDVEEAARRVAASVLESRERYGGKGWLPEARAVDGH